MAKNRHFVVEKTSFWIQTLTVFVQPTWNSQQTYILHSCNTSGSFKTFPKVLRVRQGPETDFYVLPFPKLWASFSTWGRPNLYRFFIEWFSKSPKFRLSENLKDLVLPPAHRAINLFKVKVWKKRIFDFGGLGKREKTQNQKSGSIAQVRRPLWTDRTKSQRSRA